MVAALLQQLQEQLAAALCACLLACDFVCVSAPLNGQRPTGISPVETTAADYVKCRAGPTAVTGCDLDASRGYPAHSMLVLYMLPHVGGINAGKPAACRFKVKGLD